MMTKTPQDIYDQLVTAGHDASGPSDALRERVLAASLQALGAGEAVERPGEDASRSSSRVIRMDPREGGSNAELNPRKARPLFIMALQRRAVRYGALAAAVGIVVLGALSPWSGSRRGGDWWAGPAAAWAQEIYAALDHVGSMTSREQTAFVLPDGRRELSSTIHRFYMSADSYRRDIWDGEQLRETQWYAPGATGLVQTSVRHDNGQMSELQHDDSFGAVDPMARMRAIVERAERSGEVELRPVELEGRSCVMFELVEPDKDDATQSTYQRVWFDPQTKLPVRTEFEYEHPSDDIGRVILIEDQFDWNPALAAGTFTPHQIPDAAMPRPE